MIRVLLIGRPAGAWAERLKGAAPAMELDVARLPSAGIRQFEETPADLIIIVDEVGGQRVETLVQAIRRRPLGQLVAMLLICPLPAGDRDAKLAELDLAGWLPTETPTSEVIAHIAEALDVEPEDLRQTLVDSSRPTEPEAVRPAAVSEPAEREEAAYFDGEVVLEPIDEPRRPRSMSRASIFRSATPALDTGPLMADDIRRKLKAVRHEDYYAILEVRRGAEGQSVREAFHRLSALYSATHLDFELAHKYQDELDEIGDALEDAFAVLGDPDLREPYLKSTVKTTY